MRHTIYSLGLIAAVLMASSIAKPLGGLGELTGSTTSPTGSGSDLTSALPVHDLPVSALLGGLPIAAVAPYLDVLGDDGSEIDNSVGTPTAAQNPAGKHKRGGISRRSTEDPSQTDKNPPTQRPGDELPKQPLP